jgi:hypothetical protein
LKKGIKIEEVYLWEIRLTTFRFDDIPAYSIKQTIGLRVGWNVNEIGMD